MKLFLILVLNMFFFENVYALEKTTQYINCSGLGLPLPLVPLITTIINLVYIFLPLGLIAFGSIDFVKAVTSNNDANIDKSKKKLLNRLSAGGLIFFVFTFVRLIISFTAIDTEVSISSCLDCLTKGIDKCDGITVVPFDPNYPEQTNIYIPPFLQPELDLDKYEDKDKNNNTGDDTNKTYDKNIFVGDSRTVGMCGSGGTGCTSGDWQGYKLCGSAEIVSCGSMGYSWFNQTAVSQITNKVKNGGYNIILWWGVNDLDNQKKYIEKYIELANGDWKDNRLVIVTVGSLKNNNGAVTQAKIDTFNSNMKTDVNGLNKSNMKICDISSISFTSDDFQDFVHYNKSGYEKVYNYINNNCL